MGNTRWDSSAWASHAATAQTQTQQQIFRSTTLQRDLDPKNFAFRESVDSVQNPASTPVILASDVTGSMGYLATQIIREEIGKIMEGIYDRKPVPDPHIMVCAIGDANSDTAPIQATQFEAGMAIADQVKQIWLEGNGGGNGGESYHLVWYLAAYKTQCDAMMKRGRKGYIFTIGDEAPHPVLRADHIRQFIGQSAESDISSRDLYAAVSENWNVFHLIVNPVTYQPVLASWRELIGERALEVADYSKMGEVIISTMQVCEGADIDSVAASWSGDTSLVVAGALSPLAKSGASSSGSGVVRF